MIVWQVNIEGRWRTVDPDTAALVAIARPGNVRLGEISETAAIAFDRFARPERREVSKARIAASVRALKNQRERVPLFAAHVASEQPTPERRVEEFDQGFLIRQFEIRRDLAVQWRRCRALLRSLPRQTQVLICTWWRECSCPHLPGYFMSHIKKFAGGMA